mmetsp:Transcript_124872/g.286139  ORF Transcript_124872/g.286139 Transcript_124872/m.286139 type:complete len:98 (+) Transcript_124872:1018-1311(+)
MTLVILQPSFFSSTDSKASFIGGGEQASIADFHMLPLITALRNRTVSKATKFELPNRWHMWYSNVTQSAPSCHRFINGDDQGDTLREVVNELCKQRF